MKKLLGLSTICAALTISVGTASAAQMTIVDNFSDAKIVTSLPGGFNPESEDAGAKQAMADFLGFADYNALKNGTDVIVFEGNEEAASAAVNDANSTSKDAGDGLKVGPGGVGGNSAPFTIQFTYFGSEAGYSNLALLDTNGGEHTIFDVDGPSGRPAVGSQKSFTFGGGGQFELGPDGLIPFLFRSIQGNGDARNVGALDGSMELGFLTLNGGGLFTNSAGFTNGSTIAFFGDGTGDSDLDDLVMGIGVINAVPLPAPVLLLLTALGGLGLMSRVKRRLA